MNKSKMPTIDFDLPKITPDLLDSLIQTIKICGFEVKTMKFDKTGDFRNISFICHETPIEEETKKYKRKGEK